MEDKFGIDPEIDELVDNLVNKASSANAKPLTRIAENITDDFTVTADGNVIYHGDKPVNASMTLILVIRLFVRLWKIKHSG